LECVILAGGFGTRLRPLTYHLPKPLLPLVNKPMIMHIIDRLPEEVERVVLAVNYRREMLEDYFKRHEDEIGPDIVFVEEKRPLGTGGAIKNCEKEISGTFLVFNGDVISSMNPQRIIRFHESKSGIGTLAAWWVEDPTRYGIIGMDDENRITRFLEKPKPDGVFSHYINAGTYVLKPEILDHIPSGRKVSLEREVYPLVLEKGLYAFPFEGYWVDAGTRPDFLRAGSQIMRFRGVKSEVGRASHVHHEAKILPPVVIGNDCNIANSVIGPDVVIGHGVKIERDVRIRNSTLYNGVVVRRGAVIQDSIIGEGITISEKEIVEGEILAPPYEE